MYSFLVEGLRCVPMDDVGVERSYRNLQRYYEMQKFENHSSATIKLDVYKLYTVRNQVQVMKIFAILLVIFTMLLAVLVVSKITIFLLLLKMRKTSVLFCKLNTLILKISCEDFSNRKTRQKYAIQNLNCENVVISICCFLKNINL